MKFSPIPSIKHCPQCHECTSMGLGDPRPFPNWRKVPHITEMSQLHSEENSQTWLQCCTKCRCLCPSSSIGLRPYKNLCPESVASPCSCTHQQLDGDVGGGQGGGTDGGVGVDGIEGRTDECVEVLWWT